MDAAWEGKGSVVCPEPACSKGCILSLKGKMEKGQEQSGGLSHGPMWPGGGPAQPGWGPASGQAPGPEGPASLAGCFLPAPHPGILKVGLTFPRALSATSLPLFAALLL